MIVRRPRVCLASLPCAVKVEAGARGRHRRFRNRSATCRNRVSGNSSVLRSNKRIATLNVPTTRIEWPRSSRYCAPPTILRSRFVTWRTESGESSVPPASSRRTKVRREALLPDRRPGYTCLNGIASSVARRPCPRRSCSWTVKNTSNRPTSSARSPSGCSWPSRRRTCWSPSARRSWPRRSCPWPWSTWPRNCS